MRILADSNMFIDFWRKPTQDIIDMFSHNEVVICGIIRSELMHGAKSETDLLRISDVLDEFEEVGFDQSDWKLLGELLYKLRIKGITVPLSDVIIAFLAVKNHIPVWTHDHHFARMQLVIGDLQLL